MEIRYQEIGIIRSPFKSRENMPIQAGVGNGIKGEIELKAEFVDGLKDLEGFSHLILIYHFHKITNFSLEVIPFLDTQKRGLFSTRAPRRPNPIGFSVVRLLKIEQNKIYIEDVDMLDGTPLLDIKPYVSDFDAKQCTKNGWLEGKSSAAGIKKSDGRFS
jgi:tRNA (adenine37-N6)-methyltransferase